MSKKKNTLKDLDEFLKQQAATLVSPARLGGKNELPEVEPTPLPIVVKSEESAPLQKSVERNISSLSIGKDLQQLALINGTTLTDEFCSLYLNAMEGRYEFTPEEKMLVNTALYLKHGSNWKEAIRQFWKNKKS